MVGMVDGAKIIVVLGGGAAAGWWCGLAAMAPDE